MALTRTDLIPDAAGVAPARTGSQETGAFRVIPLRALPVVDAVGHRIVHGGDCTRSDFVDTTILGAVEPRKGGVHAEESSPVSAGVPSPSS